MLITDTWTRNDTSNCKLNEKCVYERYRSDATIFEKEAIKENRGTTDVKKKGSQGNIRCSEQEEALMEARSNESSY